MNRIAKLRIWPAAAIGIIVASPLALASTRSLDFSVEVDASVRDGQHSLSFSVTNTTSETQRLRREEIPWECPASILIFVDEYRPNRSARSLSAQALDTDRPCPTGERALEPGESLSGIIDLDERANGLSESLKRGHAIVYWYWRSGGDREYGGFDFLLGDVGEVPPKFARENNSRGSSSIRVSAFAIDSDDQPSLGLNVRNEGSKNVSMFEDELPWNQKRQISLRAGTLDPPESLMDFVPFHYRARPPARPWMTIPPGGWVNGVIPMRSHLFDLDSKRRSSDVVVFWSFDSRSMSGESLGHHGGFVVFPATAGILAA